MSNIVFIVGFMGSGKTSVGKVLATKLSFPIVDTDVLIEEKQKMSVNEIFEKNGEIVFRDLEKEVFESLLENQNGLIVSCGGGFPIYNNLMDRMLEVGKVVFLDVPLEHLVGRLVTQSEMRPLIKGMSKENIREKLNQQQSERYLCYAKASLRIEVKNQSKTQLANEIIQFLKKNEKF